MSRKDYSEYSREDLVREIQRLEKQKTYGLVWEEDKTKEIFDLYLNWDGISTKEQIPDGDKFPVLKEDESKAIISDKEKATDILIEGDNYHALTVLNWTHKGKIDIIYIDPPYNTGTESFRYNDRIVNKEDPYRHSKWLSFMSKRLKLAKKLLKQDGTIFISINEEELAQLKLLCDEIFGDDNYLALFSIKVRHEDRILKGDKDFHEVIEYLLLYRRSRQYKTVKRIYDNTSLSEYTFQIKELTANPQKIKLGSKIVDVFRIGEFKVTKVEPHLNNLKKINIRGSIKEGNSSGRFYMAHEEELKKYPGCIIKVPNIGGDGLGCRYFLLPSSEKKVNADYFQGVPTDRAQTKEVPYPNYFDFEEDFNNVGYEGGIDFRNGKKPIRFLQKILHLGGATQKKNAVVVDFFAGSGTTGHAVLQLNKEDNGNRKFILCTNNENDICTEVCYPRIEKVIKGYTTSKGEIVEGLGGNLRYFKTAFINAEPTDVNRRKMVDESTEMLCIKENAFEAVENGKGFKIFKNHEKYLGIIYVESAVPSFIKSIEKIKEKISVYIFSYNESVPTDDFQEFKNVTLEPIPESILNVYRRIMNDQN